MENSGDENVSLQACRVCNRTFNPDSLERHEKICEKSKAKPRKVFNSFGQRLKDVVVLPKPIKQEETKKAKTNWKAQHEQLLRTVRSEKIDTSSFERGRPQQKVIPLGYLQCPVCRRCFNHKAADRHISWCQAQLSRLPKSPPSSEAVMRLKARTQYRAPLPNRKRYSLEDGRRLVKSAESCKSACTALRTYSSPCASQWRSKQVDFQLPIRMPARRKSCERSTFSRDYCENDDVLKSSRTLPSRSRSFNKIPPSCGTSIKFKEKFPQYNDAQKSSPINNNCRNEIQHLLYEEDIVTRRDNYDLLSALRLQMAELRLAGSSNCHLPDLSNDSSPSICGPELSSRLPRFCYHCGTEYPVQSAKYCCECGVKRLVLKDSAS